MAGEDTDPKATAATAGDPAESGAEHESGGQGDGAAPAAVTLESLQHDFDELKTRHEMALDLIARGGGRTATEGPASPPTTPDPRTAAAANQIAEIDEQIRELEGEVRSLAKNNNDPLSKFALAQARRNLAMTEQVGTAMRLLYDRLLEVEADLGAEDPSDRRGFKEFRDKHKGLFANMELARLAYEGQRARDAAKNPPKPAGNGTAPAARPALTKRVDVTRGVGAAEHRERTSVPRMKADDFDTQLAALHEKGDHDGARALQGRLNSGELDLED